MKQRKVHVPTIVDWGWIEQVGLLEGIEPFLVNLLMGCKEDLCVWHEGGCSISKTLSIKNWWLSF